MKKPIALLLAVLLLFSLSVPAGASNGIHGSDTGSMTVSIALPATYTVTIPADVAIPLNGLTTGIGSISVSNVRIHSGKQIIVTADASGALVSRESAEAIIPYALRCNGRNFSAASFTANGSQALTVDITQSAWDAAAAGSYSDTITFTVTYEAIG